MALLTGKFIDEFELLSVIGTGGFSTVYLAHNELGQEVAVKVLAENHAYDPDIRERFISEADALSRVRSDLIVEVFGLGETPDGQPYIVLQHADRGDLVQRRRTLVSSGWKPLAADVQFLTDVIADALESVHVKDLIHRDVSPSNILIHSVKRNLNRQGIPFLRSDESLLLADFGLVKDMSEGSGLTVGAGTPGFSAPEQRNGLALIDHRIDIYAASAVILWFLTGATVPTMPDWRDRLAEQELPVSLLDAIGRGLSALPEDRHQSIDEWHLDITDNLMYLENYADDSDEDPNGDLADNRRFGSSFRSSAQTAYDAITGRPKLLAAAGFAVLALIFAALVSGIVSFDTEPSAQPGSDTSESSANTQTTIPTPVSSVQSPAPSAGFQTGTLAPPEMTDAYFEFANNQPILIVLWSDNEPPPEAIGREVEIAVNDGPFETEARSSPLAIPGLEVPSTGQLMTPISRENDYMIRVRWTVANGDPSPWSPVRFVRADP